MSTFQTINPNTGQVISTYSTISPREVDNKIKDSHRAFLSWSNTSFKTRSSLLLKVAQILKSEKSTLAKLMTQEMGKRITEGLSEIDKCSLVCEYYAQNGESLLAKNVISTEAKQSYVRFEPLGVVLSIMPWNFPFWQVFRATSPAIMAGNTMLLKHASAVPACALAIEDIFTRAGAPTGLFQTLLITGSDTAQVIKNPLVRLVSLTGSEEAGSKVAELAGKNLKRLVLELGGSDPFIVMADADISKAGIIEKIELKNGKARLTLRIDSNVLLYSDASVGIKSTGLLGDNYLELKTLSPLQRLARHLIGLAGKDKGAVRIKLPYQRTVMAAAIGIAPENLSRAFQRLAALGVHSEGNVIAIEDLGKLRKPFLTEKA